MTLQEHQVLAIFWVDRYCVDKDDENGKHTQIAQMDLTYSSAQLTKIAMTHAANLFATPKLCLSDASPDTMSRGKARHTFKPGFSPNNEDIHRYYVGILERWNTVLTGREPQG